MEAIQKYLKNQKQNLKKIHLMKLLKKVKIKNLYKNKNQAKNKLLTYLTIMNLIMIQNQRITPIETNNLKTLLMKMMIL